MEEKMVFNTEDVNNNKVFGILSYIGILFLIPLFAAKDSQYARFHVNQGLVLFLAEIVLNLAAGIISFILGITIILLPLAYLTELASGLICIVWLVIGIINACSGEPKKLPVIGNINLYK